MKDVAAVGAIVVGTTALIWAAANAIGWASIRNCYCERKHSWNWRALLGPVAYFNWLERNGACR